MSASWLLPLCDKLGSGIHSKPCAGLAQPPNNSTDHNPRVIQSGIYLAYIRTTRPVFLNFHKPHTHQNLPATQRRGIRAALRRRDPGSASSPPPNFRPTSNDYQLLESNRGPPLRAWRGGIPTLVNNRAAALVLTASAQDGSTPHAGMLLKACSQRLERLLGPLPDHLSHLGVQISCGVI